MIQACDGQWLVVSKSAGIMLTHATFLAPVVMSVVLWLYSSIFYIKSFEYVSQAFGISRAASFACSVDHAKGAWLTKTCSRYRCDIQASTALYLQTVVCNHISPVKITVGRPGALKRFSHKAPCICKLEHLCW